LYSLVSFLAIGCFFPDPDLKPILPP